MIVVDVDEKSAVRPLDQSTQSQEVELHREIGKMLLSPLLFYCEDRLC